jgi:iron complex outermembrane receptor protein
MILKKYCFLVLMLIIFSNSIAQQRESKTNDTLKEEKLEEVVISSFHINDNLQNAPASIDLLSKKELLQNNTTDISTALNTIPGVLMQSSNFTTNRISIRGIGARTTYGTNKIGAFYGNIPLTSGNSETVIDDIDLENIG